MILFLVDELLVKCDGLLERYRDELIEVEKGIVNFIDWLRREVVFYFRWDGIKFLGFK